MGAPTQNVVGAPYLDQRDRCGDSHPLGQPENDSAVRLFRTLSVRTVERLLRPIWVRGARHGRGARCHRSALPWRRSEAARTWRFSWRERGIGVRCHKTADRKAERAQGLKHWLMRSLLL